MFEKWNVRTELTRERETLAVNYCPVSIAKAIYIEQEFEDCRVVEALGSSGCGVQEIDERCLDQNRIYTLNEIKKIAIDYRLRFLPSKYFIGDIPYDAIMEIKKLRKATGSEVNKFRVLAPSKRFELEDENADPLLFTPLSNGKYYLIHQWGNDLAWYKKIMAIPMRSYRHMVGFACFCAFVFALIVPADIIMNSSRVEYDYFDFYRIAFFFFMCILFCAVSVFCSFAFSLFPSDYIWKKKTF